MELMSLLAATKQDVIQDLTTIRSGAALGATALQSVPDTYRTATAQDAMRLDSQVKAAMCDGTGTAWSTAEQEAAQARIGILTSEGVSF